MGRWLPLLVLLSVCASTVGYTQPLTQITDLDTSNFPVVQFSVQFPNRNEVKRYVNQTNTVITENGIAQDFEILCPIDQISFAIVLDKSLSMAFKPNDPSPFPDADPDSVRWRSSKSAIKNFTAGLTPPDSACLISFAQYPNLEQDFTHNGDLFARAVEAITLDSYTGTWLACEMALDLLKERPGRRAIILLNDGGENVYRRFGGPSYFDILADAQTHNVAVYSIGLGEFTGTQLLQQLSDQTGGTYYLSADGTDLTNIYNEIIASITTTPCQVRYTAEETCPDGSLRSIHISSTVDSVTFEADTAYYSPFNLESTTITTRNPSIVFPNQEFNVEMEFESFLRPDEPTLFSASFQYDNEAVEFLGIESDSSIFIENPPSAIMNDNGILEISGKTNIYSPQNKYLFTLRFRAKEIRSARIVSFSWLNIDIVRKCNTVSDAALFSFAVDGLCDKVVRKMEQPAIRALYPNPATSVVNIEVVSPLSESVPATLKILSDDGQLIDVIASGNFVGKQIHTFNTDDLTSGTYFITLNIGGKSETAKLIVTH